MTFSETNDEPCRCGHTPAAHGLGFSSVGSGVCTAPCSCSAYVRQEQPPTQCAHHVSCWRDPKHHACAVKQIERLATALGEIRTMARLNASVETCVAIDARAKRALNDD